MNAPESTCSFLLDEDTGETKIVYTSDTKVSFVVYDGIRGALLVTPSIQSRRTEALNPFRSFLVFAFFSFDFFSLKVTNAGTFRFNKEDHTVGNLFRMQLLSDPSVRFAGYFHPHPLVYFIDLKIQTNNSTVAPVEVLSSAIEDLANETDHLMTQFQEAMENFTRESGTEIGGQF